MLQVQRLSEITNAKVDQLQNQATILKMAVGLIFNVQIYKSITSSLIRHLIHNAFLNNQK